jgi:hypothetical protein
MALLHVSDDPDEPPMRCQPAGEFGCRGAAEWPLRTALFVE